jgi:MFS family permease
VASAAFLVATVSIGSYQYIFGLFIEPLETEFGWSRTQISASLSFVALGTLTGPFVGIMIDKHGAKPVMLISVALTGLSFLLRPFMTELWHFYAISALQFVAFNGTVMLPAGRLVGIWFKKNKGRALGLTMMGNNFGGLALTPIIGLVLVVSSWQAAYYVVAGMFLIAFVYTFVFVDENPPPDEVTSGDVPQGTGRPIPRRGLPQLTGATMHEALRSRNFYILAIIIPIGSLAFAVLLPHMIANFTHAGISVRTATGALSMLAAGGMLGKVVFGMLGERISGRNAMMISFSVTIVGIVLMLDPGPIALVWVSSALFGFGMGAFGPLYTLVVQDNFGLRSYGAISGLLSLTSGVTFAAGPILGGLTYDLTDTYWPAFGGVAAVIGVGVLLLTQIRPPAARK